MKLYCSKPKKLLFLGGTSKTQKNKIHTSPKKVPKPLSGNSFHLFYKLDQTILLVYKSIESFPLRSIFFQLLVIFYYI